MDWLRQVPIGQYVAGTNSWLCFVDPRLKFSWVLMFLLTPILAGPIWRVSLVLSLFVLTFISFLPVRVWWRSLCLLLILSCFVGCFAMFLPTIDPSATFSVRSPQELPSVVLEAPSWELFKLKQLQLGPLVFGPFIINRRSAELGLNTSTLIFTVIHSVNLMLLTTSPEDLMWSLRWFMTPLGLIGLPVDRLSFQFLLALRFIPLVQEEFQNLLRALAIRAVNFKELGFKAYFGLILSVSERLLSNILLRAEQGADAFLSRGGLLLSLDNLRSHQYLNRRFRLINLGLALFLLFVLVLRRKYGDL